MVRVVLDLSEIRLEMGGIGIDSGAYQLQCAVLAVNQVWLSATLAKPSKFRMLLPSWYYMDNCPGAVYDRGTSL